MGSFFLENPWTWKILTYNERIVGYWHYVCMKSEYFEKAKAGNLRDSEITPEMIISPSYLDEDESYNMYFIMIAIEKSHEHPSVGRLLLKSFVSEMERAAKAGVLFSEIVAVAFTPQGLKLCNDFGMESIGRLKFVPKSVLAEIFSIKGKDIPRKGHLKQNVLISGIYRGKLG